MTTTSNRAGSHHPKHYQQTIIREQKAHNRRTNCLDESMAAVRYRSPSIHIINKTPTLILDSMLLFK